MRVILKDKLRILKQIKKLVQVGQAFLFVLMAFLTAGLFYKNYFFLKLCFLLGV
jgi:hypothetical protein